MARASGSYPLCPEFKSLSRHQKEKILSCEGIFFYFVILKENVLREESFIYKEIKYK